MYFLFDFLVQLEKATWMPESILRPYFFLGEKQFLRNHYADWFGL
jgi:hypothetical protein